MKKNSKRSIPQPINQNPLSEDDLDLLDSFCDEVDFEDISFENWRDIHKSLDLILQVQISYQQSLNSGAHKTHYVKTRKKTGIDGFVEKHKTPIQVVWPDSAQFPYSYQIRNGGDETDGVSGHLKVIISVF